MDEKTKVRNLLAETLEPYSNHPFKPYEGVRFDDMIKSIKENGVISPIIVRQIGEDRFEILSGHNRVNAAKKAGLIHIPAIVHEDLADEIAALIVTETNMLQRSYTDLSHSERAVVLKNHLERLKLAGGQGQRTDLTALLDPATSAIKLQKSTSRDKAGDFYGLSHETVRRYVRLAELTPRLLQMVDDGGLNMMPAVELSYLNKTELGMLECVLTGNVVRKITPKTAKKLRAESGDLTEERILAILGDVPERKKKFSVPVSSDILERLNERNFKSSDVFERIIEIYLDKLDEGTVEDVFANEDKDARMSENNE